MGAWIDFACMVAVMAPLLAALERLNPEVEPKRGDGARRFDVGYVALQVLWVPACGVGLSVLLLWTSTHGLRLGVGQPVALQAGMAYLLAELSAYWIHRLEHSTALLWRVHAVHHAPHGVNWMTTYRFHPFDVILQQCIPLLVVVAAGLPVASLVPYLVTVGVVTLFAHCNVAVRAPALQSIIVTPGYHRSHHEQVRATTNLAMTLPLMDIVFGTASFKVGERAFGTPVESKRDGTGWWSLRRRYRKMSSPAESETPLAT